MATTIPELQLIVDNLITEVSEAKTVQSSAVTLLNSLGQFFIAHKDDPAAIEAMGTAMTNASGDLDTSANELAAAITANTPTP